MSVNQSVSGQPSVLVSQPGGSFVTLIPNTSQSSASAASMQRFHYLKYICTVSAAHICFVSGFRFFQQ